MWSLFFWCDADVLFHNSTQQNFWILSDASFLSECDCFFISVALWLSAGTRPPVPIVARGEDVVSVERGCREVLG